MIFYDKNSREPAVIFYGVTKAASTSLRAQVLNLLEVNSRTQTIGIGSRRPIKLRPTKLSAVYSSFISNIYPVNELYVKNTEKISNFLREQILIEDIELSDKHLDSCQNLVRIKEEKFNECFKVINVRNPYARLYSTYREFTATPYPDPRSMANRGLMSLVPWPASYTGGFSKFIEVRAQELSGEFIGYSLFDLPQYAYGWYENELHYDHMIRVENYEEDWAICQGIMAARFGTSTEPNLLKKKNVKNKPGDWKCAFRNLTDHHLELAHEICKEDAEIFGYELDLS